MALIYEYRGYQVTLHDDHALAENSYGVIHSTLQIPCSYTELRENIESEIDDDIDARHDLPAGERYRRYY